MRTYQFILVEKANHSIRILCRVLKVSRSAWYVWRSRLKAGDPDARIRAYLRAEHRASKGTYGRPRLTKALRARGFKINHKRVAQLMQEEGLQGISRRRSRPRTTDSQHSEPVAPNQLNRGFNVRAPNQVWVGDITYLRTRSGFVYLAVIIDLFSRKVVGWKLRDHMRTGLCLDALKSAIALRNPSKGLIYHSDRGSQYASKAYADALRARGVVQSMSRKGDCWDNAVAESFFATLKRELVRAQVFQNLADARERVSKYIHHFYNSTRLHSTNGYRSPNAQEADFNQALKASVA